MALKVEEITLEDDLDSLVAEINNSYWDEPNEISEYDVGSLKAYLNGRIQYSWLVMRRLMKGLCYLVSPPRE